jgi:hypothetical protein
LEGSKVVSLGSNEEVKKLARWILVARIEANQEDLRSNESGKELCTMASLSRA